MTWWWTILYGEIQGNLDLASREDVARFVNILRSTASRPAFPVERFSRPHREADDDMTLDAIEKALADKGYLRWLNTFREARPDPQEKLWVLFRCSMGSLTWPCPSPFSKGRFFRFLEPHHRGCAPGGGMGDFGLGGKPTMRGGPVMSRTMILAASPLFTLGSLLSWHARRNLGKGMMSTSWLTARSAGSSRP